jgi:precorrin-2 dehydrogenase/sirohydrochlorin ferrochelatase
MPETPDTLLSYTVALDLRGRLVVVVGPGEAAQRKARAFLRTGADVAVITPDPTPELIQAETDGQLTIERRPYVRGDLEGALIAVCVSDSPEVAKAVGEEAASRGCLVHVKGAPELSSYSVPSTLRRGALQIAVSTGGAAPAVARRIRARLVEEFGEEWADYLRLLQEVRQYAEERAPGSGAALVETIADSDVLERLRAGETLDAETLYEAFAPGPETAPAHVAPEAEG